MATGGEVPGRLPGSAGSEHHSQHICQTCLDKDSLTVDKKLCVDCKDYLCSECLDDHTAQHHRVLDREQMLHGQTQAKPEDLCSKLCPINVNEAIQCDEVHHIPHVSKEFINNEDYRQVESQLKSTLDIFMNVYNNVQRNSEEIDKSYENAARELNEFKRHIIEILEKAARELAEQMETFKLKTKQQLSDMKQKYNAAHEELHVSLVTIESLQSANQNCSFYIEMMRTKEKIKSLVDQTKQAEVDISYRQPPIQFTPNRELMKTLRNPGGFGTLSSACIRSVLSGSDEVPMSSDTDNRSVSSGSDITILSHETVSSKSDGISVISDTESMISQPFLNTGTSSQCSDTEYHLSASAFGTQNNHLQELNVKTELDKSQITGMVVLPDSRLVLTDHGLCSIKAVDVQTSQVVAQMELTSRPCDVTSIQRNKVAVTMPYENKVAFMTVRHNTLSVKRIIDVDGECWGIDFKSGKLAVSFIDQYKIQILDLQGYLLYNIATSLIDFPSYLTFGQDDKTVYVSNTRRHNVVRVKMDGSVVATYRDKDLRDPRNVVVDSSGNVFVCAQGSNTVHQITKDCMKLHVLLTEGDGLDMPWSICLCEEEDKLYVGMRGSDYVKVYRTCNDV